MIFYLIISIKNWRQRHLWFNLVTTHQEPRTQIVVWVKSQTRMVQGHFLISDRVFPRYAKAELFAATAGRARQKSYDMTHFLWKYMLLSRSNRSIAINSQKFNNLKGAGKHNYLLSNWNCIETKKYTLKLVVEWKNVKLFFLKSMLLRRIF